jgi:GLPGLI family protein
MKPHIAIFLSPFILSFSFFKTFGQSNNTEPTYRLKYSGYVNLTNSGTKTPNLEGIVLQKGEYAVTWHELADNFKPVNNDSVTTVTGKNKKMSTVYKNYKKADIIFEYSSAMLKKGINIFSDTLYPMSWVTTGIQKKIDSLICYKAMTIFRGRAYVAWFCPQLPIHEGPWKFGGLPGAIVEVYDEEKAIYWKLKEFSTTKDVLPIAPQPQGNFLTFQKEFKNGFKKVVASMQSEDNVDPSCISCKKDLKIKVDTIENLIEN